VAVVTVTVATLLASPGVRVIEVTARVGIPVTVIVPVAGEAGMMVVSIPVEDTVPRVTLKQ
jgi:2-keto-3-deoxy-6-phosphogluconate aldolase